MTIPTLSWVPRNKVLQGDVPVDHFAAGVAAPEGWQVVVEWRFRADPGDDWGPETSHIRTPPECSSSYTPPGDGWVRVISYSIQDTGQGTKRSRGTLDHEFFYVAGEIYTPGNRITDAGDDRITDAGDTRITE